MIEYDQIKVNTGIDIRPVAGLDEVETRSDINLRFFRGGKCVYRMLMPSGQRSDLSSIPVASVVAGSFVAQLINLIVALEKTIPAGSSLAGFWCATFALGIIPLLTIMFRPKKLFPAGIVHDIIYRNGWRHIENASTGELTLCTRAQADEIYRRLITSGATVSRTVKHKRVNQAVRLLAGWSYWALLRVAGGVNFVRSNKK